MSELAEFDKKNPREPIPWVPLLVCPYCKVDYTLVKNGRLELKEHMERSHKASQDYNASL